MTTEPTPQTNEQPNKGGRPKGRKTKPVEIRLRDKILRRLNAKPDVWWEKLSDNAFIQLLKRVLPASGPIDMPQDVVDRNVTVTVQYAEPDIPREPGGTDEPKAEQPEAAPDLPQTVAPSEPVKPDLSLLTGGDLIAAVHVNPDSDEAKALKRMVDEAATRLLDERIAKDETAKEFSDRMYAAKQRLKNQRRMLNDPRCWQGAGGGIAESFYDDI